MEETLTDRQQNWLCLFIVLAVAVNFSGLFVTIMGPDGALYATIAKTMVLHHDYVNLVDDLGDKAERPRHVEQAKERERHRLDRHQFLRPEEHLPGKHDKQEEQQRADFEVV